MSHYAIVKRQRYWIKPEWVSGESDYSYKRLDKVKYEDLEFRLGDSYYVNLIKHEKTKGLLVDYWQGEIHHKFFDVKEKIIINGESFTVKKVEKNVDGSMVYEVDGIVENIENYDELLAECEKKYEDYSIKLNADIEAYQKLKEDYVASKNPFTDPVQVKSRWKRFFERR